MGGYDTMKTNHVLYAFHHSAFLGRLPAFLVLAFGAHAFVASAICGIQRFIQRQRITLACSAHLSIATEECLELLVLCPV